MRIFNIIFIIILFIPYSCKRQAEGEKGLKLNKKEKGLVVYQLKQQDSFDKQIKTVDEYVKSKGGIAGSLDYSKSDGSSFQSFANLDKNGQFIRVDENFFDAKSGARGQRFFYIRDEKFFACKELIQEDSRDASDPLLERISYFSKEGYCLKTKQREFNVGEENNNLPFTSVALRSYSIENALNAINRKNGFRLAFKGFIEASQGTYIEVGEPGSNRYSSVLKVDDNDPFIKEVLKDQFRYLNASIYLTFETISESNGFLYQHLLKAAWSKESLYEKLKTDSKIN